ncbi:hypothetical protein DFH07DRAFT_1066975 [Mycena maculata]|uniref:AB hydrolase-1 domain-containing protein n=1 Tax=Mycena maculata TaxID=230809 RepID=A0AAD7MN75_9AGAR|nr:hypothetical protein DFH07DRAFT_1066975 [Mycena maculata]
MRLPALCVLLCLSKLYLGASSASCGCSPVVIPVHVDVLVPKNATDIFAGLKSNSSSLRLVDDTYNIYGVFCQPQTVAPQYLDILQLLVHGMTYTSQYWSPPTEEFRNYSYVAFSCDRGLSSIAIDWLGVGLSFRPENASDVQYPSVSAAISQIALHLKTTSVLPGVEPFRKIIGIGHSTGSYLLNFGAIVDARSPFDALVLTSSLIPTTSPSVSLDILSARDADPLRWGRLDLAYVTTTDNRTLFYPVDPTSFSARMLLFDAFTRDVGSMSTLVQGPSASITATHYTGPVAKVVGSEDQIFCAGTDRCADVAALTAAESVLWPAAEIFEVMVSHGSGHDLNLDFFAEGVFHMFVALVDKFSA